MGEGWTADDLEGHATGGASTGPGGELVYLAEVLEEAGEGSGLGGGGEGRGLHDPEIVAQA